MRKVLFILFILNVVSCSPAKIESKEIITKTNFSGLKIAQTTKIIKSDTISFNELRFKKIHGALDTMKSMYIDFGIWDHKEISLHQDNITRKVWQNVKLFDDNNEVYTIIADGTETVTNFYACLTVFDSKGHDCFDEHHPLKNKIINYFFERMKENESKNINYLLLR